MPAGARHTYSVMLIALAILPACRCGDRSAGPMPTRLEAAIAQQLGRRAEATLAVTCTMTPPRCTATTPDGAVLPITLVSDRGAWTWHVEGLLVRAQDLESMITNALGDLEVPQTVACGARVRRVAPDDRIECVLGGGGRAFVVVHGDGATTLELALDPEAGSARAEVITEAGDRALEQMSGRLEAEDADEEESQ